MHASMTPAAMHLPCTAATVGFRKSRIRRQRSKNITLLVPVLPLRASPASDPPFVGLGVSNQSLEVVSGTDQCLPLAARTTTLYIVVGVGQVEGRIEFVDHLRVLGVGHLGSVESDEADVHLRLL